MCGIISMATELVSLAIELSICGSGEEVEKEVLGMSVEKSEL